jgi:hypothetical protein
VTALSLSGLRRRIEALMLPDDVHIVLHLDRAARLERDRRRRGGAGRIATMVANNATSAAAKFSVSALWLCQ